MQGELSPWLIGARRDNIIGFENDEYRAQLQDRSVEAMILYSIMCCGTDEQHRERINMFA